MQNALGQHHIDELLKLSEEFKKAEQEIAAARSSAGGIMEERREEFYTIPPPPVAVPAPLGPPPGPPPPVMHTAAPVAPAPSPPVAFDLYRDYQREGSPARSTRSRRSHSISTSRTPVIIEPREYHEYSEDISVGPLALVSDRRRGDKDIKLEIARLEAERDLLKSDRHHHHHHSHSRHRSHSRSTNRELVSAERLPTGELVLYEEQVERIEEPRRGVRLEKDKKGRMSISVPKYR